MTSLRIPPGVWAIAHTRPEGMFSDRWEMTLTNPLYPIYCEYIGTAVTGTDLRNSPISRKLCEERWREGNRTGKPYAPKRFLLFPRYPLPT